MESHTPNRRAFLRGTFFTALGAALGTLVTASCQRQNLVGDRSKQSIQVGPSLPETEVRPSTVLSLTVLQAETAKRRQALPDELTHLGGMNRIRGFMTEPDRELLLLGDRDSSLPPIHLDDLVVALRNAYQVSPAYQGAPGCSIDPWPGAQDPWRIQEVKVFGMPATAMAARHVSLDFELKKVSAGTLSLGDGVTSPYELARSAAPLCKGPSEQKAETTHRFWFYPLYPAPPRFMEEESTALILKPVDVQLLTEQEFLDQTGQRKGSAPAAPQAEGFARLVTQLLAATNQPRHYAQLRSDFRVIEVGQLLRFKHIPAESLRYFLQDHLLAEVVVPAFVGGIRREERGEVVCEHQVTERRTPQGRRIESREQVQRYHFTSRGGVEARVSLSREHFVEEQSGALADLRRRVRASRPSAQALLWAIEY